MQSKITDHFEPMSRDKPLAPPLARIRDYTAPLNVKPRRKLNTEWNGEALSSPSSLTPLTPIQPRKPPPPIPSAVDIPRPTLKRKVTPHPDLWQPNRMPFERTASDSMIPKLVPSFEHVKIVQRPVDASPPILPESFDCPRAHFDRDLEANAAPPANAPSVKPRVVPILGQLPDNWQLGVAIGVAVGLVLQLIQTGVNSSLKTGQSDILAKLTGQ